MDFRFKEDISLITFPTGFDEEDRGLKECCKPLLKLASVSDTTSWKNDIAGVKIAKTEPADNVEFVIEKCGIDGPLALLGDVAVFPQDPLAVGFIFRCNQYLATFGPGKYTITANFTISGITGGFVYAQFDLLPYSISRARRTVRVWSEFNSKSLKDNIDYTGSNFKDCIRFGGLFGDRDPQTEVNNLINKKRRLIKTKNENVNLYELRTNPVDIRVTRALIDQQFLNQDICLITDHNSRNHDYGYLDFPVSFSSMDKPEYIKGSRLAKIVAKFGDQEMVDVSHYNQQ